MASSGSPHRFPQAWQIAATFPWRTFPAGPTTALAAMRMQTLRFPRLNDHPRRYLADGDFRGSTTIVADISPMVSAPRSEMEDWQLRGRASGGGYRTAVWEPPP